MAQIISAVTLLVPDYDSALAFYVGQLGFELLEDTPLSDQKRWVRVRPKGGGATCLLLAKAEGDQQQAAVGQQAGGRVGFFLTTDDFTRDHAEFVGRGVNFMELPRHEPYGTVAVFSDPFGNLWDLIQPAG